MRRTKRSYLDATTAAIVVVVGLGVFWAMPPLLISEPNFELGVHIGDTFQYTILIHGDYPQMDSMSPELYQPILDLNGMSILVNVTSLPSLEGILNSMSFWLEIANASKVDN